jgi:hypothetical protein
MVSTWNSLKDAEEAARVACEIYKRTNALPADLVEAYKYSMVGTARPGVVSRFYKELMRLCPEAVKYFSP